MTDWAIFGGDPVPGAAEDFEALASALRPALETAQSSGDSIRAIAQGAGSADWSGSAAVAFVESIQVIPNDLSELVDSHRSAIGALNQYGATLRGLQQRANEALDNAALAQSEAAAASSRLSSAQVRFDSANEAYWHAREEVGALEIARHAADIAGDHTGSYRLSQEIAAAIGVRNTAWSNRTVAESDIQTADSVLNQAHQRLGDEQRIARGISIERDEAAQSLIRRLSDATEFVVRRRSWLDRVRKEFDSVGRVESSGWRQIAKAAGPDHIWGGTPGAFMWVSKNWGWVFQDAIANTPNFAHAVGVTLGKKVIKGLGATTLVAAVADGAFRAGQDLEHHHFQAAFEVASRTGGSQLLSQGVQDKSPLLALVGLNVILWSDVETQGRHINWSELVHHPSSINPFQPGGPSAIWQAEKSGLSDVGKTIFGSIPYLKKI